MSEHPNAPGRIHESDDASIWVRTWAQVIEENRSRMQFFQERLEYEADKGTALRRLQRRHADLLEGVLDESELAQADDEATPESLTDVLLSDSEDFDEENSLASVAGPLRIAAIVRLAETRSLHTLA